MALLDPALDVGLTALRGYFALVTSSPAAPLLSRPSPVKLTGFELALEVAAVQREAADVVSLTLASEHELPVWSPGAHLDVLLPSGRMRQYSLCGNPADRHTYRIAVRLVRDGGGGSAELHESVRAGDTLTVRGPRNAFLMVPEPAYLFVAGGIGITPILSMVRAAETAGAQWRLVYVGRSRETLPFLDELAAYGDKVQVHTDDVDGIPDVQGILQQATPGAAVYLCGPPALADRAKTILPELDPTARLYTERFSAPPIRGGDPFEVRLARSGRTVQVGADESMLTAIRRELPGVAYSCQQGFCGTCKVTVLESNVEQLLPCIARCDDTVLIDL